MDKKQKTILVDSDAFVALASPIDSNHNHAKDLLSRIASYPVQLACSNYVIAESATVISQRIDHQASITFLSQFTDSSADFTMIWIYQEIHEKALDIFRNQTSKNISVIDCANMALLQNEDIACIFSFDKGYRKNGFLLLSEWLQKN